MKKFSKMKSLILMFIFSMTFKISNIYAAVTCDGVLGNPSTPGTLGYYVNYAFQIMRWSVPALVIIMGSIDLTKAVISSSEDKMKKAQQTFLHRIIIGIAFFFIPDLVNLLLRTLGETSSVCLFNW